MFENTATGGIASSSETYVQKFSKNYLLNTKETAAYLGGLISPKTLANWRSSESNPGPQYYKIGNRVFYPIGELRKFQRLYHSTKDYGKKV